MEFNVARITPGFKAICLMVAACSVLSASAATHYIDYVGGNDANAGTTTGSPWKLAPGMLGFAGTYTHAAGDRFIFKGGVSWPAQQCFLWRITSSGTTGSRDYYGVDASWFTGASWTRPIFDAQNSNFNGATDSGGYNVMVLLDAANYVTFDNLDFNRLYWNGSGKTYGQVAYVLHSGSNTGVTYTNCYFHAWSKGPTVAAGVLTCIAGAQGTAPYDYGNTVTDCIFDGETTANSTDFQATGTALYIWGGKAIRCTFRNLCNPIVGGEDWADWPEIAYCEIGPIWNSWSSGEHDNAIRLSRGGGPWKIHHNYIHDSSSAMMFWGDSGETVYFYDNVCWNPRQSGAFYCDPLSASGGKSFIFNNTLFFNGSDVIGVGKANEAGRVWDTVSLVNNHFIQPGTVLTVVSPVTLTHYTNANNVTMSSATATSQGYTLANRYQPTLIGNGTVDAGQDLSSVLAGALSTDFLGVARPQGAAWDSGAYEFGSAAAPGTISIASPTYSQSEGSTPLAVSITRTAGSSGIVGITYATEDGTATAGVNYTLTTGTLSWPNGNVTSQTINIPVNNTSMVGNKAFRLRLSLPTGGATLGQALTDITLLGTGTPPPCVLPGLTWQLEDACTNASPMVLGTNGGNIYAYQPVETLSFADAGKSTLTFTNVAGQFRFVVNVNAPSLAANSFFVSTNGAASMIWDITSLTGGEFQTRHISIRGTGTPEMPQYPEAIFTFAAATTTLVIGGREANTLLDYVTLEPVEIPTPAPTVVQLSTTLTNLSGYSAAYASAGSNVPVTVNFSTNVIVTGTPVLQFNSGGTASYTSGTTTSNLLFNMIVGPGENSQTLNASGITMTGATIRNNGVDAVVTLPSPGDAGSLSAQQTVIVDTVQPITLIGPPSLILTFYTIAYWPVSYIDLNLGQNAPAQFDTNTITITKTGTANGTLYSTGPPSAIVGVTNITGNGTMSISLSAATGYDLAGNPSLSAGPSQAITVSSGSVMQVITVKAGTVISGSP